MREAVIALCVSLSACAAVAGAPDPLDPAQQRAPETDYPIGVDLPSGIYELDRRHASVLFRIRHMELAWFTARFDTISAILDFNAADPSLSRLEAQVDANSVNTNVLNARNERAFDAQIARALGGGPIRFVSTHVERNGRYTARVTGDLTMNGQTHPAALDVTFAGARADPLRGGAMVLGFSARAVIDRTQWRVDEWRAFTGDDVQLVIEAELVRR